MSTYNLGYAVMDFKYSTLRLPEMKGLDINLKFYGRDDAIGLPGHNAMKWSMIFLYELEIYFDRKLPLQDMTMIAIPEYPVPVREGFGFIIWQEEYLLELSMYYGSNPQNLYSSSNQATRQWIEGYVTIKSWTDLWFIEGLCMYLSEVIIGRSQFAQLGLATYAVTDSFINVLNLAALQDSEAVS